MTLKTSALGFGLSGIAGSGNFAHQEKLVRTAIDCGITHFDVAPYYGSGDAEKILGSILANCLEKVTITTKYGLSPLNVGRGGSVLRKVLRPVFKAAPFLKRLAAGALNNDDAPKIKTVEKGALTSSLNNSIKNLRRTPDILLLHDAGTDFAGNRQVITELDVARQRGNVLLTGISGDAESVTGITTLLPKTYMVAQLENSLTVQAQFPPLYGAKVITHRAIQGGLQPLNYLIQNRPGFKQIWLRETGVDPLAQDNLAQVLIELALYENLLGTVLFSTTKPGRVKQVANALSKPLIDGSRCRAVRALFNMVYLQQKKSFSYN